MLSIFIMFSRDRFRQLERTISFLRRNKLFQDCQKTLVVDGRSDRVFEDFEMIQVPRLGGQFSWANMWDAGVATARHPAILYLDSDRLVPSDYLERVLDTVRDDQFLFTARHYMVLKDLEDEECAAFLANGNLITEDRYMASLKFEPRLRQPPPGPGKNVMSGNTAFTKRTYLRLGGVDPWYRGHGAFADTDFHMEASVKGCQFVDLGVPELHWHHAKIDANDIEIDGMSLARLALDNLIYYCHKWGLPMNQAENAALKCRIFQPVKYVKERLEKILKELEGSPGYLGKKFFTVCR